MPFGERLLDRQVERGDEMAQPVGDTRAEAPHGVRTPPGQVRRDDAPRAWQERQRPNDSGRETVNSGRGPANGVREPANSGRIAVNGVRGAVFPVP